MKETIKLSAFFNATPKAIYEAWLDSDSHSAMTGGDAKCTPVVGDAFSAWDGYITGSNIQLQENEKIEQRWRTSEFSDSDGDSLLLIHLKPHENGTILTLIHSDIPKGQTQYENGWKEHYFEPMTTYFNDPSA